MKLRSKKVLSLLLAASMVLGMNTIAFADDVAEVAATEETAEVAASTNGTFDHYDSIKGWGLDKDGNPVSVITYATNGAKKNALDNVVTITNVSDPISWNNYRGKNIIKTVLYGDNKNDEYLNNKAKLPVSSTNINADVPGSKGENDYRNYYFDVVKVADGAYLFVSYGLFGGELAYVAGQDEVISDEYTKEKYANQIPIREWDGRKIAYNKSGDNNATKSSIDALDVKVALVKYENGTLTELNGASVANVKIDKKAIKKSSVAYAREDKKTDNITINNEHAALGDLPSFTLNVKLDKSVKKTYAKDLKTALKDKKYFFGIMQRGIKVTDPTNGGVYQTEYYGDNKGKHWSYDKDGKLVVNPASANDAEGIQKTIAEEYATGGYVSNTDKEDCNIDDLKVSKFTEKKANVAISVETRKKGKDIKDVDITLKAKKDYELKEGTLAGEKVVYIDFPEGGNYVYANTAPESNWSSDLSVFGYKWAFRKSPVAKSKKFRYGIYAANDLGFVYSK